MNIPSTELAVRAVDAHDIEDVIYRDVASESYNERFERADMNIALNQWIYLFGILALWLFVSSDFFI